MTAAIIVVILKISCLLLLFTGVPVDVSIGISIGVPVDVSIGVPVDVSIGVSVGLSGSIF